MLNFNRLLHFVNNLFLLFGIDKLFEFLKMRSLNGALIQNGVKWVAHFVRNGRINEGGILILGLHIVKKYVFANVDELEGPALIYIRLSLFDLEHLKFGQKLLGEALEICLTFYRVFENIVFLAEVG